MKPQTLCCVALLWLVALPSAATEAQSETPELSEGDPGRPATKGKEERSGPQDTTTSSPYEPFVPSESISGDSSVAFPVDI